MRWIALALVLTTCIAATTSNTDGYSISCSSEFTPVRGSFCVGIPLKCQVQLSGLNCNSFRGPVLLATSDISLQVRGSDLVTTAPDFALSQVDYLLNVTVDYSPSSFPSTVRVQVSSFHAECTFDVNTGRIDVSSPTLCSYPLLLDVMVIDPSYPGEVEGGDIISLDVELTASSHTIEDFVVAVGNFHPGLFLLSNSSYTSTSVSVNDLSYTTDIHDLSSGNFQPIMFFDELSISETLSVSLSFQVQPFVLPKAALYFSFHIFYYISSYGDFTFRTSTGQFKEFITTSPQVDSGAFTLNLPHFNDSDHVINTFPPHSGGVFEIHIPFYIPCLSTSLNIDVTIPEFSSGSYTFLTNVTNVTAAVPANFFSLPSLCDYTDVSTFDSSSCYMNSISNSNPPEPTLTFPGLDTISVDFGPVWRKVTVGGSCVGNGPDPSCYCDNQQAELILYGVVLTDLPCEKQSITDDLAVDLTFEHDVNVWTNTAIEFSNEVPSITRNALTNVTNITVSVSSSVISSLVSSHTGDAGDSFNITVEIQHSEVSGFSAYDLNVTLIIDQHFVTDENIMICFFQISNTPSFCENTPAINNTINWRGRHDEFQLNVDRIEMTLGITILQEVAPGATYNNTVEVEYRSFPVDNPWNVSPLSCSNSTSGPVTITPVEFDPWFVHSSTINLTETESPATMHFVTFSEEFAMTLSACMPESITSIRLFIQLPNINSVPLVIVNATAVTFIGSELNNTVLSVGESTPTSPFITLTENQTLLSFYFGSEVLIAIDNNVTSTERCFQISLNCTVMEHPSLQHGSEIVFAAYVETDFNITSEFENITFNIVEAYLKVLSGPLFTYDAGDTLDVVLTVIDTTLPAYRLNLTVTYPTEFFFLNLSDPNSLLLYLDGILLPSNITDNGDNSTVTVTTQLDVFNPQEWLYVAATLFVRANVPNAETYIIPYSIEWHQFPYGYDGGRSYSLEGEEIIQIKPSEIMIRTFSTSNPNTPCNIIQLQEYIIMEVAVTLPEGISSITLQVQQADIQTNDYTVAFSHGEVLHIGNTISGESLSIGDTHLSSSDIVISDSTITFSFGSGILNTYDNINSNNDSIIVNITAYTSTNGTGVSDQSIVLEAEVLEVPGVTEELELELVHPQLQLNSLTVEPSGPWDGGDHINVSVIIDHATPSSGYIAYDIILSVELEGGYALFNMGLLSASIAPDNCSEGSEVFTIVGGNQVMLSHLFESCSAEVSLTAQIPDTGVFAGENVTVLAKLSTYYGTPDSFIGTRKNYGPGETLEHIVESQSLQLSVVYTTIDENTPDNIIQMEEQISMNVTITLPEGMTSSLMVQVSQVESLPTDYMVNITQGEVLHIGQSISNTLLSEGDTQITSSYITVNDTSNPQTIIFDFGQGILNTHDNVPNVDDTITVLINAHVYTNGTDFENQNINFKVEILEFPSQQDMIQFELEHVNVQLNSLSVEPSGPFREGDSISISITFNHSTPITGYIAYDVLITTDVPLFGLLASFIEPSNCSQGGEVFTILNTYQMILSHLFVTCDAEITLAAQIPDMVVTNPLVITATIDYYGTPISMLDERTGYQQQQTLSVSVQIASSVDSLELTVVYNTSDVNTPDNMIQIEEQISVNVTVTLPDGMTPSLTIQVSQVESLPTDYMVNITQGEVLHIGQSISNTFLSEGDTQITSSYITVNNNSSLTFNVGQNIFNMNDFILNVGDRIILLVKAFVTTSVTQTSNQMITFKAHILEDSSTSEMLYFNLFHVQLQLNPLFVEPLGPLDGGDTVNMSLSFNHMPLGGFVAYDVVLVVEQEGGYELSGLTLLRSSLEPSSCAIGDEEYTVSSDSVQLTHLSVECTANLFLTAQLSDAGIFAGKNITILASLARYSERPVTAPSMPPLINYGNEEIQSFEIASKIVHQTLTASVAESINTIDIVHTIIFPEGRTLQVMVEYRFVPTDLSSEADILNYIEHTVETIQLHPSTDISELTLSNLGNIFNPSNNVIDEDDTAIITSRLDLTQQLNFTIVVITTYDGNPEPLSVSTETCFRFIVTSFNIIEVDNVLILVITFMIGILIGVSMVVICVIIYVTKKKNQKTTIAPALIAAIMGKESNDDDKGIFREVKTERHLFSSLLAALPVKQWQKRDDTYECKEADYISEVESDLFYLEGKLTQVVINHLLERKTALSAEKVFQLKSDFLRKVSHLRTSLRNGMTADMQAISLEYGADKILKSEKLSEEQEKNLEQIKENLPYNTDVTAMAIDHFNEENKKEKVELMSTIEVKKKEAEQKVVRQYMSHFVLGTKGIAINLLQNVPNSKSIVNNLKEDIDSVGHLLVEETSFQENLSFERGERQKKALLQKKIIDESDMRWKDVMLNEIENYAEKMDRLGLADSQSICKEMKDDLTHKIEKLQESRARTEADINSKACEALRQAEVKLNSNIPKYGSVDAETATEEWHAYQLERENALKQIETKAIEELTAFWDGHNKKRTEMIEDHVSGLSVLFLSKGMKLRDCDKLLRELTRSRMKLREELESNKLIQMAKLQARLDQQKERLAKARERNKQIYKKKAEMEQKLLENRNGDLELMEQYHKDVADLQKSLALEKLRVHLKMKEKLAERKKRKFEAVQRKYIHTMQHKIAVDGSSEKEAVKSFIDQRKEVAFEIDTRYLEDERRKAEEEFAKEKQMALKEVTQQAADLLHNLEREQENEISAIKANHEVHLKLRSELRVLSPIPGANRQSFANEANKVLEGYKQQMSKISDQLEEKKKKSAVELERKMRQRRMQRERTIMELVVQDEAPLPGIKSSRFKEVVIRVMMDIRMKQLQQRYTKELSEALEKLEDNYNSTRNEAFEKLEKKFEVHLTKVGKISQTELVDFFRKFESWQSQPPTAKELRQGRSRRKSTIATHQLPQLDSTASTAEQIDPLVAFRQRQGELPPLSALSRRRGTIK